MNPGIAAREVLDPGAEANGSLQGMGNIDAVDLVVGSLLKPISAEADPQVVNRLVGNRVVHVKSLTWLHAVGARPHERLMIDGVPEIVDSCTEVQFPDLIGQCVVGIKDEEVVADIRSLAGAVSSGGPGLRPAQID